MDTNWIDERSKVILDVIKKNNDIKKYVDSRYEFPKVWVKSNEVKLVIIGQDPTVVNENDRKNIKYVLNLDKDKIMKKYVQLIVGEFEADVDNNVYATNFFKNFFIKPPTWLKNNNINMFELTYAYWAPLLVDELNKLPPNVPVITLGENVFDVIKKDKNDRLKYVWGYPNQGDFRILSNDQNILNRLVIPFPHEKGTNPSEKQLVGKSSLQQEKILYYHNTFNKYCKFVKEFIIN